MLVKVTDYKGKERYINAAFVKAVHAKSDDECEIEVSGWAYKVKVKAAPAEVAQVLNHAMPDLSSLLAPMADDETTTDAQTAATIAVIG
ncbi:MAG: hypothetical protein AAGI17_05665 [Planctomycetota bacterium]